MNRQLTRFLRDESGQDIVEYSLLLVLIAMACIVVVTLAGQSIAKIFERITTVLNKANDAVTQ